ncbi:hypothetical protein MIR68_004000 [Amoeboaphelidium protococcarum]|nr:hypothetical protein MIR68_004000 [Amoeboaphelidium protococcarum]
MSVPRKVKTKPLPRLDLAAGGIQTSKSSQSSPSSANSDSNQTGSSVDNTFIINSGSSGVNRSLQKLSISASSDSLSSYGDNNSISGATSMEQLGGSQQSLNGPVKQRRPRPKPIDLGAMTAMRKQSSDSLNYQSQNVGEQGGIFNTTLQGQNSNSLTNKSRSSSSSNLLLKNQSSERAQVLHKYLNTLADSDLELLQELGEGSGGTVYRVRHIVTNTIMAKKSINGVHILNAADGENGGLSKEIARELRILGECQSKFIVSFYGAFISSGELCICMEYMDAGSLESIARVGSIKEPILGHITISVLEGLVYLYEKHRIVHRDIKPSNILINKQGQIKLCDFGVSGQLEATFANTFVGTGAYMSPERIQGAQYSTQSDSWSLGLTLLELALGKHPLASGLSQGSVNVENLSPFDLLTLIVNGQLPKVPDQSSGGPYTRDFSHFVELCLDKDPQSRPSPSALLKGSSSGRKHPFISGNKCDDSSMCSFLAQVKK